MHWRELAGQLPDYIQRKLTNWDKERGQKKDEPDNSSIMQPIAHDLTDAHGGRQGKYCFGQNYQRQATIRRFQKSNKVEIGRLDRRIDLPPKESLFKEG